MSRFFSINNLFTITVFALFSPGFSFPQETSKAGAPLPSSPKSIKGVTHDALVYPTEVSKADQSLNRGGIPSDGVPSPCPDGDSFCESADDYPQDLIKNKLKKQPKLLLDQLYEEVIEDVEVDKFGPESGDMSLCSSSSKVVYPKKAKSKEGVFEFVVNDDEYRQGVKVEACTSNGECSIPGSLSLGYKSRCVQKHILRTLVVLNKNSSSAVEGFVTKPFEFPSCCSCVISMTDSSYRFADDVESVTDITPAVTTSKPNSTTAKSSKP